MTQLMITQGDQTTKSWILMAILHILLFSECDEDYTGDGYCDDALNIPECNFDVGDCCLPNTITDFCFTCQCFNEDNYVTPMPFWKTTTVEPTSKHYLRILFNCKTTLAILQGIL